jgi:DNA-binding MarR family transcriptional regulator
MNLNFDNKHAKLSLLEAISEEPSVTQRLLSKRLGLALGLINLYVKNLSKEGLIKIEQSSANRCLYLLTPKGFASKTKLLKEYLSSSLQCFQQIRHECLEFISVCAKRNYKKILIVGDGDLADIAELICSNNMLSVSVSTVYLDTMSEYDCWFIASTDDSQGIYDALVQSVGISRIFVFSLLGVCGEVEV